MKLAIAGLALSSIVFSVPYHKYHTNNDISILCKFDYPLQPVQTEEWSKNTLLEAQEENDLTPNFLPVKDKEDEL